MENLAGLILTLLNNTSITSEESRQNFISEFSASIYGLSLSLLISRPQHYMLKERYEKLFPAIKNNEDKLKFISGLFVNITAVEKLELYDEVVKKVLEQAINSLLANKLIDIERIKKFKSEYAELIKTQQLASDLKTGEDSNQLLERLAK